ncbi:MAG: ATP-binding protein [Anaerolineae bacterium]
MQTAAEVLDGFPDGAWLVELARVTDPESVPQAVAAAVNAREQPGIATMDVLRNYLGGRNLLLVLDNCEHLLDSSARLVDALLHAAPQMRVLATSREALNVEGEVSYPVAALPLPEPSAASLSALSDCESVRLFVDRAAAAHPAFALSEANASAVAQIATRLDGLPLALELAASRTRGMTVEQIASRLDDRFHLLTGGSRTALPRQRTLEAAIDWSYDLLSEDERALLRRLSVFVGTWTLEAAQHVAAFGALQPEQVIDLLPGLVEKSLVVLDLSSSRYHMLETVRAYGLQRLVDAGEETECRTRYVDFYLAFAESCNFAASEDQNDAAQLFEEQDNLVAAILACEHLEGGGQSALRLMEAMGLYWMIVSQIGLGYRLARHALGLPGAEVRTRARARALIVLAQLGYFQGRSSEARAAAEESLSITREVGDRMGEAISLHWLAAILDELGNPERARTLIEESLRLAKELQFTGEVARIQNDIAETLRAAGDFESARELYEQSLEGALTATPTPYAVFRIVNLAMVTIQLGDLRNARELLAQSYDLAMQTTFLGEWWGGLHASAGLASALEDWSLAARLYGASEAQRAGTGETLNRADEKFIEPLIGRARSELGDQAYQQAYDAGRRLAVASALDEVRAWLAEET